MIDSRTQRLLSCLMFATAACHTEASPTGAGPQLAPSPSGVLPESAGVTQPVIPGAAGSAAPQAPRSGSTMGVSSAGASAVVSPMTAASAGGRAGTQPSAAGAGLAPQLDAGGIADPTVQVDAANPEVDAGPADQGQVPADGARGNALTDAYAALTRGDRTRISAVVSALDKQSAADPDDRYAVFYAGAFRLWQLAESLDLTAAPGVLDNLERAHSLLPNDFRVTGFFGLSQVVVGGFGDALLLAAGLETLQKGVEQQPVYGHFLRATAVSSLSATHSAFKTALSDMQGVGPDCQVTVDAEGTYHYPQDHVPTRSRICTNEGIVPHAWEGYFLSFGDIALKSGWDAERARAVYRSAQTAPTYQQWPFKQDLERRIQDAERNAAAFGDENPLNDPTVWALDGKICVGCHQK